MCFVLTVQRFRRAPWKFPMCWSHSGGAADTLKHIQQWTPLLWLICVTISAFIFPSFVLLANGRVAYASDQKLMSCVAVSPVSFCVCVCVSAFLAPQSLRESYDTQMLAHVGNQSACQICMWQVLLIEIISGWRVLMCTSAWAKEYWCNDSSLDIVACVMSSYRLHYVAMESALCTIHFHFFKRKKKKYLCHCYVSECFSSHWSGSEYAGNWRNQA